MHWELTSFSSCTNWLIDNHSEEGISFSLEKSANEMNEITFFIRVWKGQKQKFHSNIDMKKSENKANLTQNIDFLPYLK